ncbi:MAG: hypothetical protein P9L92_07720 [Candidatus Electryonea clarkiae]|nr:hypothetical protein [Candidatus Electryonea clarkiae]MDP8285140.1 hypothetical protein [Candidatus Electryonea clarkiae]
MHEVLNKIKSRGYWKVIIRPSKFIEERISDINDCRTIVRDNNVLLRGWDYPHYDTNSDPICGLDYVEQFTDWEHHIEGWRFYQSGQFTHYKAISEDWGEENSLLKSNSDIPPNEYLSIIDTVYLITEICEFASRLASKSVLGDSCQIHITLSNTKNRKLFFYDRSRYLSRTYQTILKEIPYSISPSTTELISRSNEIALEHIVWLFKRFNWKSVVPGIFKEDQIKLIERRL